MWIVSLHNDSRRELVVLLATCFTSYLPLVVDVLEHHALPVQLRKHLPRKRLELVDVVQGVRRDPLDRTVEAQLHGRHVASTEEQ